MSRYFFHIHDSHSLRDDEGVDLAGPQEAAQYAKQVLPEIAAHEVGKNGEHQAFSMVVPTKMGIPSTRPP